ncbi:MAG: hypothetical protein M1826_000668 [Phylliscum demangeonii]|nr:MAG: hypothetical protein M1826_000668 [Phylliscum demangeonii]
MSVSPPPRPPPKAMIRRALAQVKSLYLSRQYKACAKRCDELLLPAEAGPLASVHPIHTVFLYIYAGVSLEFTGRALHVLSEQKISTLQAASARFARAHESLARLPFPGPAAGPGASLGPPTARTTALRDVSFASFASCASFASATSGSTAPFPAFGGDSSSWSIASDFSHHSNSNSNRQHTHDEEAAARPSPLRIRKIFYPDADDDEIEEEESLSSSTPATTTTTTTATTSVDDDGPVTTATTTPDRAQARARAHRHNDGYHHDDDALFAIAARDLEPTITLDGWLARARALSRFSTLVAELTALLAACDDGIARAIERARADREAAAAAAAVSAGAGAGARVERRAYRRGVAGADGAGGPALVRRARFRPERYQLLARTALAELC